MNNGHGNADSLSDAQQILLQKYPHLPPDDPLVELAAWNAALEQKVDDFGNRLDIWTTAILKQTDLATDQNHLIVSQNLTLQETAKNNALLGQTLLQFKTELTQLQQEFTTLKTTIDAQGNTLQRLSTQLGLKDSTQSLSSKLASLSQSLKTLDTLELVNQKVETLTAHVTTLQRSLTVSFRFTTFFAVLLLIAVLWQGYRQERSIASLQAEMEKRIGWVLINLKNAR